MRKERLKWAPARAKVFARVYQGLKALVAEAHKDHFSTKSELEIAKAEEKQIRSKYEAETNPQEKLKLEEHLDTLVNNVEVLNYKLEHLAAVVATARYKKEKCFNDVPFRKSKLERTYA